MVTEENSGWCYDCDARRLVRRRGINHLAHLLLTVCTAGVWIVVWGYMDFKRAPWRCSVCGSDQVVLR